jgi:hypothetical protein
MGSLLRTIFLVIAVLLSTSCADLQGGPNPETVGESTSAGQSTPTAVVLADSFFYGCAYLDANGNDEIDDEDPGLKGATFVVTLKGGAGFGAPTPDNGCVTIVVPGGLGDDDWPVTTRMEPPEDSDALSEGSVEVVLEKPQSHADFLFVEGQP